MDTTQIAAALGIAPATLTLLILVINRAANIASRLIPNDATGFMAVIAKLCAIIGTDVSSRVTAGVSVQDIAKQTITPPVETPVVEKLAADKGVPVSEVTSAPE